MLETDRAVRRAAVALLPLSPGPVRWLLDRAGAWLNLAALALATQPPLGLLDLAPAGWEAEAV